MTGMLASCFGFRAEVPAVVSVAPAAVAGVALFDVEPLLLPCCARGLLPWEAAARLVCRVPDTAVVLPPEPAEADLPTEAPDSRRVREVAAPAAGGDETVLSRLVRLTPAAPTLGALARPAVRAVLRVSAAGAGLGEARLFSAVWCARPEAAGVRPAGEARGDAVLSASVRDGRELLPPPAVPGTALAASWGVAAGAASSGSDSALKSATVAFFGSDGTGAGSAPAAVAFFGSDGAGAGSAPAAFGEASGVGSGPCCAALPDLSLVAGSAPLLAGRPEPALVMPPGPSR